MTIAIWCIFIAATLPYVAFGFVKGLDPERPRFHVGDLAGQQARGTAPTSMAWRRFPGSPRP